MPEPPTEARFTTEAATLRTLRAYFAELEGAVAELARAVGGLAETRVEDDPRGGHRPAAPHRRASPNSSRSRCCGSNTCAPKRTPAETSRNTRRTMARIPEDDIERVKGARRPGRPDPVAGREPQAAGRQLDGPLSLPRRPQDAQPDRHARQGPVPLHGRVLRQDRQRDPVRRSGSTA